MESLASFKAARNLARKTLAIGLNVKQILAFFLFPLAPFFIDTFAGYHRMNMRMEVQFSAVRMQDHGQADFRSQVFWIQAKILKGIITSQ